jgi:hypothetical protein
MSDPMADAFKFVVETGLGRRSATSDPNYLAIKGVEAHLEDVLIRDKDLLCQGDPSDCTYHDGGDSAQKTGIAAFCNSHLDQQLLPRFMADRATLVCRNPDQEEYRNPYGFGKNGASRDQVIQYAAGCWRGGRPDLVGRMVVFNGWTDIGQVNQDILLPNNTMFLRACAGMTDPAFDPIGQLVLALAIQKQGANDESNGLIVHSIVCGQLDHFLKKFPDYQDQVHEYWGVRSQWAIGDALIAAVEAERSRYGALTEYAELRKLLRLVLGPFATAQDFAEYLFNRFRSDPKAFLLALLGADPRLTGEMLRAYVTMYVQNLVEDVATIFAIAGEIMDYFSRAEARTNSPRRKSRFQGATIAAAGWYHEKL